MLTQHPDIRELTDVAALPVIRGRGLQGADAGHQGTPWPEFGVDFDVFFSEQELHDAGAIEDAVARLREQGHVYDDGGAVWLRTTDFGDDKDRVMIRANGEPTYFAADAAYYLSKKDRGFTEKIYLLGADHHGYINRLKAIAAAAGDDPEVNIEVLIGQLVSVNGAKLSKRAGNIIELKDLIDWLGKDAVRYSLARFPADSPLTLDPELLKKHSNENPVFYVQYAHARSRGAARNAVAAGVERRVDGQDSFDASLLDHADRKRAAVATWAATPRSWPRPPNCASRTASPATWRSSPAPTTAGTTPAAWRPLGEEPITDVNRTRLWLNDATSQVLANGLDLLGVSAPERM